MVLKIGRSVGLLCLGLVLVTPLPAQEMEVADLGNVSVPATVAGNTDDLAAEVAALRERLNNLEAGGRVSAGGSAECVGPGWKISGEYLNWRLQRRDLDFAVITDASALAVGAGAVQKLEFDREAGTRVGLAFRTPSGWELGITYTHFLTSAEGAAEEPVGGAMWATRSHPAYNQEAGTANAYARLDYNVYDLEAAYSWAASPWASLKVFGGPRWAMTEQQFRVDYDGRDFSNAYLVHPVNMNAFGLRLGFASDWHLGRSFSLFGRGAGSVMYGKFHAQTVENNLAGSDTIVDIHDDYRQAVPVLEAAMGLSWCCRRLEVSAGYEIIDWFNVGDRSAFVNDVHEGLYSPASADLLLDGFFLRCAWTY